MSMIAFGDLRDCDFDDELEAVDSSWTLSVRRRGCSGFAGLDGGFDRGLDGGLDAFSSLEATSVELEERELAMCNWRYMGGP